MLTHFSLELLCRDFELQTKLVEISALNCSNSCASLLHPQICSLCEFFYLMLSYQMAILVILG